MDPKPENEKVMEEELSAHLKPFKKKKFKEPADGKYTRTCNYKAR